MPKEIPLNVLDLFKCPDCESGNLRQDKKEYLLCTNCGAKWQVNDGIYDFREKI
ncbi:MAG: hypothetical protein HC797_07945 [Anaerolineales bacterium]|nr:hypothetical protein [Anaerolineales bacterium]